ncbi:MAG TPA: hypothetical protein VNK95_16560 [Caldilineaceae bacterium]|nr:hypothetical protein [Caldilineaceae bacterium]
MTAKRILYQPENISPPGETVFAADTLIPPIYMQELAGLTSKAAVQSFAARIGIHPGIVVGRLQHDGIIPQSWMNELKDSFTWREPVAG